MAKRIAVFLLLLAFLPSALAAGGIGDWVFAYNVISAETGAPALDAANAFEAAENTYVFAVSDEFWLGVILSPEGEALAVFAEAFTGNAGLLPLMSTAASVTDLNISPDEAREKFEKLLKENSSISIDMNGQFVYLVARDREIGTCLAVYDLSLQSAFGSPSAFPDILPGSDPNSDFWDGLWDGDDKDKPTPAPTDPPAGKDDGRIIYKIESRKKAAPSGGLYY